MENGQKNELFSYLSQEYDICITEKDIYEIEKILEGNPFKQSYWHCNNCGRMLHPGEVTLEEEHDKKISGCGMKATFLRRGA